MTKSVIENISYNFSKLTLSKIMMKLNDLSLGDIGFIEKKYVHLIKRYINHNSTVNHLFYDIKYWKIHKSIYISITSLFIVEISQPRLRKNIEYSKLTTKDHLNNKTNCSTKSYANKSIDLT